ncbi:MAG TPA: hypothetical protein VGO62_21445, partial [Myxococcota bacterium]
MQRFAAQRTEAHALNTGQESQRPTSLSGTLESATHPLVVHYGVGISVARATTILGFFDDAWEQQVVTAGFSPPLDDGVEGGDNRFDVYAITLDATLGGITFAEGDTAPTDGKHASQSFIEIDPALSDDLLEVYSHHEFQHALQFAVDTLEPIMWYESTAVFWEVRTRPDVDDWVGGLPDFQSNTQMPIFADSIDVSTYGPAEVSRYEYGAALFALYLDEVHGDGQGTVLRQIWNGCAEPDGATVNEPDFIDAMSAQGIDVQEALADFAGWRALVGPLSRPDDGPRLEAVPATGRVVPLELIADNLDGDVVKTTATEGPFALGCATREVTAPANVTSMPVEINAAGTVPGQVLALSTIVFDQNANTLTRNHDTTPANSVHASATVPANALLQFAVCDVTPADPEDPLVARPITLSVLRTDIDFPDAGPAVVDAGPAAVKPVPKPKPPTCDCQGLGDPQSMRAGLAALGVVVGLFSFGMRLTRQRRRNNMFKKR